MDKYIQIHPYRTACVGCSGATISGGLNTTWQPSTLNVGPFHEIMHVPQKGVEYMQESIYNLLHAQKHAVEAGNYHKVVEYGREFAQLLDDNVQWLARIQEEIGECNKKLDQLLQPREPQNKFRFPWQAPAPVGK